MRRLSRDDGGTRLFWITNFTVVGLSLAMNGAPTAAQTPTQRKTATASVKTFDTPQHAAQSLIAAAETFDIAAIKELFGPDIEGVVLFGDQDQDRQRASEFVAKAHEKQHVSIDLRVPGRATLLVGADDWPFPIPIVKHGTTWAFDTNAGRKEMLYRRIGRNELDEIEVCRGYVEAQHEYALQPRQGYDVNQYAQRIISTPGTQDGLAWKDADGKWAGPVGEAIARAIERGYTTGEPYHGYFFKVLKGQGPAAPLGEMDYVVKGVMIGGFALVASPAEYKVTGVKTFIVSNDGVVFQKDLGPSTLSDFAKMDRFNPDRSWAPVAE